MEKRRWVVLQHLEEEGPGLVGKLLHEAGESYDVIRPDLGEEVPDNPCFSRGIVMMGGPMNVDEAFRYPFLARERELLRKAVTWEIPVLGICLGAQMLARACGAKVHRGPSPEIGFGSVDLTSNGRSDSLFTDIPFRLQPFHWHGDTFELPKKGILLASNHRYQNQAFRIGRNGYGFQFHLETTEDLLKKWLPILQRQAATTEEQLEKWRDPSLMKDVKKTGEIIFRRFIRLSTMT